MISAPPLHGHLNPLIGVTERLLAEGHQVELLTAETDAHPSVAALLASLPAIPIRQFPHRGPKARQDRPMTAAELVEFVRETYIETLKPAVEPVLQAIRGFAPHVMAIDPFSY